MKMYYIAIVAPAAINEKVLQLKQMMAEKYKSSAALKSPAHITIIPPFWLDEPEESRLTADIQLFSAQMPAFHIALKNFDAFKPRTIFIRIVSSQPLNDLKSQAEDFFGKKYGLKSEQRPFHPHITIATRDLHRQAFKEAWSIFEKKKFTEEFLTEGLSLLKHNGRNWDVVLTAPFADHSSNNRKPGMS